MLLLHTWIRGFMKLWKNDLNHHYSLHCLVLIYVFVSSLDHSLSLLNYVGCIICFNTRIILSIQSLIHCLIICLFIYVTIFHICHWIHSYWYFCKLCRMEFEERYRRWAWLIIQMFYRHIALLLLDTIYGL